MTFSPVDVGHEWERCNLGRDEFLILGIGSSLPHLVSLTRVQQNKQSRYLELRDGQVQHDRAFLTFILSARLLLSRSSSRTQGMFLK